MNLQALTAKKVAGIPVIYVVLGVVVIGLYGAIKLKPTAVPDTTDTSPDTTGDLPDTGQPVFGATPVITQPSGVTGASVSTTPMSDTDTLWSRRAIDYLRQNGYTLDVATSAITKYLAGEPLTTIEAAARDKAVQQFGLPPESTPETSTLSNPTTPTYAGPAAKQGSPPTTHTVRGTSDDTSGELNALYYGHVEGGNILIQSANPGKGPGPYAKGSTITIPRLVTPRYYVATSATRTAVAIAQKNGTTAAMVRSLNPGKAFPVAAGTRVRVR